LQFIFTHEQRGGAKILPGTNYFNGLKTVTTMDLKIIGRYFYKQNVDEYIENQNMDQKIRYTRHSKTLLTA